MAKGYSSGLLTGLLIGAASALLIAGKKSNIKNDITSGANVIKEKLSGAKANTSTRATDDDTDDDNVEELLPEDALEATIDDAEEVASEINEPEASAAG